MHMYTHEKGVHPSSLCQGELGLLQGNLFVFIHCDLGIRLNINFGVDV